MLSKVLLSILNPTPSYKA